MKNITDEILNDYIDNTLDIDSVNKLNQEITENDEALIKLKALRAVDSSLKKIPVLIAPDKITERIMDKILSVSRNYGIHTKRFMIVILSVLGIMLSGAVIAFWTFGSTVKNTSVKYEEITKIGSRGIEIFQNIVKSDIILSIVGAVTLVSLISIYLMVESYKKLNDKLNKISR